MVTSKSLRTVVFALMLLVLPLAPSGSAQTVPTPGGAAAGQAGADYRAARDDDRDWGWLGLLGLIGLAGLLRRREEAGRYRAADSSTSTAR